VCADFKRKVGGEKRKLVVASRERQRGDGRDSKNREGIVSVARGYKEGAGVT